MHQQAAVMISKAIFPIAGLGTRFLPATKASPKEMLAVVDKPLIQYAVEEAYSAGIRQMIFVTGRNKRAIEDHFDVAYELEADLLANQKLELIRLIEKIKPHDMDCVYVRQPRALGLGHAVMCAQSLIGTDDFAVLLADDLMLGQTPILKQMIDINRREQCSVLAVQNVAREDTRMYGVVAGIPLDSQTLNISKIVEKPLPELAPTTLAVAGRYILSAKIFDLLRTIPKGSGGEIQLTDGISMLLAHERVLAYQYQGIRFDCGSKLGLLQANVVLGLQHTETRDAFSHWLMQTNLSASPFVG